MTAVTIGTNDGRVLTQAALSITTSGADTAALVAASVGRINRLYALYLVASAPTSLTVQDGTTALSGAIPVTTGGQLILPMNGNPWFTSSKNNAINITTTGTVTLTGMTYSTTQ